MTNPKGNPESLEPHKLKTDREEALTETLTLRVTESMKNEVKAQDDPPEFMRQAIREKLDKQGNSSTK